jgi:carotenoid cleavage dioxygenase
LLRVRGKQFFPACALQRCFETCRLTDAIEQAGGDGNDGSRDIVVYTINADGVKTEECWYKAPFCGIIHDCGVSDNWVELPMTPLKCDPERQKKGENHWAWDPEEDQWYGLVPRRGGKPEDIRWFRSKNGKWLHDPQNGR